MPKMLSIDITDVLKNADPIEIAKAAQSVYGMAGIRTIQDMWDNAAADLHHIPTAHEIPSGPAMRSSSTGAERAVSEYSNPAGQMGLMEKYREFEKLLSDYHGEMGKSKEIVELVKGHAEALGEAVGTIMAFQKRAAEEAEVLKAKKEEKKSKKMDKFKEKAKSCAAKAKTAIAELTAAIQKAAEFAEIDLSFVSEARKSVIDAGAYAESYVDYETKGDVMASFEVARKAKKEVKKAWEALVKAERSALASHGLHGHGNQKDEAYPDAGHPSEEGVTKSLLIGDARDQALGGLQILSEAKANGGKLPEGLNVEVQKAEEEKKEEMKEEKEEKKEEKKPEMKAEAPLSKDDTFKAAIVERMAQIENRLSSTPNKPNISPVILKSGIQSDSLMKILTDKLQEAQKEHTMSEEGIGKARNLLDRLRAVAKGRLDGSIVQKQLDQADDEVRNFFYVADKELMSANA